jgi:WhiB family redox-sensing transcriptional regulator
VTGVNVPLMRRPPEWMDRAACVDSDPEAFFVAGESALAEAVEAEAKAVCRTCDVAAECWQYATERGERFGIWAGVNLEKERRRGIA